MKNKLSFLLLSAIFIYGCGEAGIESDISKISEATFLVLDDVVNSGPDNVFTVNETFDFAGEDFEDYIDDAQFFKINKLTYEFFDYTNISGNIVLLDLMLETNVNGNRETVLALTGVVIENTGTVLAYEEGNPESFLSSAQIAALEDVAGYVENQQEVEFIVTADFTDGIDSDFRIKFSFDLTARVNLD